MDGAYYSYNYTLKKGVPPYSINNKELNRNSDLRYKKTTKN